MTLIQRSIMPAAEDLSEIPTVAEKELPEGDVGCANQTWPYIAPECLGNRKVRVLPTPTSQRSNVFTFRDDENELTSTVSKKPVLASSEIKSKTSRHKTRSRSDARNSYAQSRRGVPTQAPTFETQHQRPNWAGW
jgi:hypothetical protein